MKIMKTLKMMMIPLLSVFVACSGGGSGEASNQETTSSETENVNPSIAAGKGVGEIKHVDLDENLDEAMIKKGHAIVDMKCSPCHKLNDQRVVGPGFQGVTNRRRAEWIMNMITNVEVMLDEDPVAQALLEECLTRMPNQNVSIGDARDILEFLRSNDLKTTGTKDEANI